MVWNSLCLGILPRYRIVQRFLMSHMEDLDPNESLENWYTRIGGAGMLFPLTTG